MGVSFCVAVSVYVCVYLSEYLCLVCSLFRECLSQCVCVCVSVCSCGRCKGQRVHTTLQITKPHKQKCRTEIDPINNFREFWSKPCATHPNPHIPRMRGMKVGRLPQPRPLETVPDTKRRRGSRQEATCNIDH